MFLVSIIVPIYNVEQYLPRCIESIVSQTYPNIEIILVNDGSTDSCLDICEQYASKDSRIKIINKNNGGLSSARNVGLETSLGEYIMFVDSDDWIACNAVEVLLHDLLEYGCSISIGQMEKVQSNATLKKSFPLKSNVEVLTRDLAISRMLQGEWISACAKLYCRSVFSGIRFPIGRTNEDYPILIYLFERTERIVVNSQVLYFYYTRNGSICTSTLNIRKFDEYFNAIDVLEYIECKYPAKKDWIGFARNNLSCSLIKLINAAWESNDIAYNDILKQMLCYLRENFRIIMINPYLGLKYKMFILAIRGGRFINNLFLGSYRLYSFFAK